MTHLRGVKPALSPDSEALTKAPAPPKWLNDFARAEWKRVLPQLIARRVVTKADLTGVESYCVAAGRVREIEAAFRVQPLDKVLFGMQNRAMQTVRQLAAEYGLSPVSRARIGGNATDEDDAPNPLLIGRNRPHA